MEIIKGFKAFNKGLECRGKKYEENSEVIEDLQPSYNIHIECIHSSKVGGSVCNTTIESDTWYWFEDGKLKSEK